MRLLSPALAGLAFAALSAPLALAQDTELHPALGQKSPREVLNKDILALPEAERTAWIHGAISGAATALSGRKAEQTPCFMAVYQDGGTGLQSLHMAMEKYPEMPASAAILAVADVSCPGIRVSS